MDIIVEMIPTKARGDHVEVASSCCFKVCTLHGEKQEAVEGHFHRARRCEKTYSPFLEGLRENFHSARI